ncbi:hypothetical protein QE152_g13541 [Popillia japonica]|uniref:Uncharacterized protein n=1 Tax=Popillia japonica TaxID=7064 RepID=A0AAW1LBH3_POPJA
MEKKTKETTAATTPKGKPIGEENQGNYSGHYPEGSSWSWNGEKNVKSILSNLEKTFEKWLTPAEEPRLLTSTTTRKIKNGRGGNGGIHHHQKDQEWKRRQWWYPPERSRMEEEAMVVHVGLIRKSTKLQFIGYNA